MFVYEYEDEMLLVDCGIGFPEIAQFGIDVLIPDVSYIQKRLTQGATIVGMCLTHGHDDHIAALPYILPMLKQDFPIYGSILTAAFAEARLSDHEIQKQVQTYPEFMPVRLGKAFSVTPIAVTHSIPESRHLIIHTPEGIVYHGSDFKFDMNPVDHKVSDFASMALVGREGVSVALVDCLRVERSYWSPSESSIEATFEREIEDCQGKFIVTLMSSNLHRVQQAINVAHAHQRKVVFIGRSVEQNVKIAEDLKLLTIPKGMYVHKRKMNEYQDRELCVIIAGSQGQPGSSLVRAVFGEHPIVTISKKDKVVFSTEAIPGNESNVYSTIDELAKNRINIVYSDIDSGLHVSGHAGEQEQKLLLSLLNSRYVFPIGGTERHRVQFAHMANELGYNDQSILLPKHGEIIELKDGKILFGDVIDLKELMVDGLGVGDVGASVLADRKRMAEEGMIVVIIPESAGTYQTKNIMIVSRGFVFMRDADEVITLIKNTTAEILTKHADMQEQQLKREIERQLSRAVEDYIERKPLILPVFVGE